jgi:hypothetical protein
MVQSTSISLALLFHELLQRLVDFGGHVVNFVVEDARSAQRFGQNFETSGRFEPFVPSSLLQSENCGEEKTLNKVWALNYKMVSLRRTVSKDPDEGRHQEGDGESHSADRKQREADGSCFQRLEPIQGPITVFVPHFDIRRFHELHQRFGEGEHLGCPIGGLSLEQLVKELN